MPVYANELDDIYRQMEVARLTAQAAQSATPQLGSNVSMLLRDFPWLPPGAAYALAGQGLTGAAAAPIANASLQNQVETNPTKFQRNRLRAKRKEPEVHRGLFGSGFGPDFGVDLTPGKPLNPDAYKKWRNDKLGFDPEQPIKPVVRTAAVVANTAYQGVIGLGRSAMSEMPSGTFLNPEFHDPKFIEPGDPIGSVVGLGKSVAAQTEGGQAVASLARGEPVDFGSGYLPSPDSPQAKRAAAAARYYSPQLYAGHAWTPGRQLADFFFEPDTTPYTILSGLTDAAVALSPADPTATALGVVGEARQASKTFQTVADAEGLVRQIDAAPDVAAKVSLMEQAGAGMSGRPFIREKNPVFYLYGPEGSAVVDKITAESSTYKNWVMLNRKAPIELVDQMSRATDPAEVRALLASQLGTTIDRIPEYRTGISYNRWLEDVPDGRIDLNNVDGSVRNIELALKNASVSPQQIEPIINNFVGAYGRGERFAALESVFDTIKAQVLANGAPQSIADDLGRMFKSHLTEANKFWVSSVTGDNAAVTLKVGDTHLPVDGPVLSTERLSTGMTLPDYRTVRRMVSPLRPIYETSFYKGAVGVGDWLMSVWKPVVLLRPAWTVRVLGEEQVRLAVSGTGLFRHPISYLSAVIGDTSGDSRIARWLDNLGADPIRDRMIAALEEGGHEVPVELLNQRTTAEKLAQKVRDSGTFNKTVTRDAGIGDYGLEGFTRNPNDQGLGDAITQAFSGITDTRKTFLREFTVVDRESPQAAEAFVGELRRLGSDPDIQRSLRMSPSEMKAWGETGPGLRWRRDLAAGRDDAFAAMADHKETWDSYVDMIFKRRDDFTRGDSEILDVLRTQKLLGKSITDQFYNPSEGTIGWANALLNEGRGPDYMKAQKYLVHTVGQKEQDLDIARGAVSTMFDWLMTKPSNYLNRSPDFRIKYWDEAINIAPDLSKQARAALLNELDSVSLPSLYRQNVRSALVNASGEGSLTLEAADTILKKRSLDHVQGLLYDIHKRNQTADVLRLVFPFGEAFKEIVTTWARLIAEHPQVPRRAQQMFQGAREAMIDPETGLPTGSGGVGFFRWDPQTQQEVFTYPGSEFLTKALTGVPVPLKGSVQGLNLIGTGLPGVGPAVSIPASWFLPDKPQYDTLRNIIFPMGKPDDVMSLDYFMPAWAKKLKAVVNGPSSDRLYSNTVFDVARYLNSTGDYNLQGPDAYDEMNRLLHDAKESAKWLYLVRAGVQAGAPSAPGFDIRVEDKSGNSVVLQKVMDDYRQHLNKTNDPTATMDWFLQKYGVDNIFATQSKSTTESLGITSTTEQRKWATVNADQVSKYPKVWALFAPEGTKFSPAAYQAEIDAGDRKALTPDEMARRANDRLAKTIYEHAKQSAGPKVSDAEAAQLRDLRDQLRMEYPGYGPDYSNRDTPTLIVQLQQAMTDPKLARTEAGRGLAYYMQARESAMASAKAAGLAWPTTAAKAQPLRDYLAQVAQQTIQQWPAFRRMWDELLSSEVEVNT